MRRATCGSSRVQPTQRERQCVGPPPKANTKVCKCRCEYVCVVCVGARVCPQTRIWRTRSMTIRSQLTFICVYSSALQHLLTNTHTHNAFVRAPVRLFVHSSGLSCHIRGDYAKWMELRINFEGMSFRRDNSVLYFMLEWFTVFKRLDVVDG